MWILLSNSFLSLVAHRTKPGVLMVRARVRGDIERVFPGVRTRRTPVADYLYRAEIQVDRVAAAIANEIGAINYPNFKGSVRDPARHDAYFDVWNALNRLQIEQHSTNVRGGVRHNKRSAVRM